MGPLLAIKVRLDVLSLPTGKSFSHRSTNLLLKPRNAVGDSAAMNSFAPLMAALSLQLVAALPACLDPSQTGALAPVDVASESSADSANDLPTDSAEDLDPPAQVCRTFATSWDFPDAGYSLGCAFDVNALTMTCAQPGAGQSIQVEYFPSLQAFISARELGAATATKQVTTDNDGTAYTSTSDYDNGGKLVGSVLTKGEDLVNNTAMTAWDAKGRWTTAMVEQADGCSWKWTRSIDDTDATITISRIDSPCNFDVVTRTTFNENGILVYSESGSTAGELSGGGIITNDVSKVCLP